MRSDEMKYYRDPSGSVETIWAFLVDGSQDGFIPSHLVLMADDEVDEYYKPKPQTEEQLTELVQQETGRLRKIADDAIAPLLDAVDLDEATEAEAALLKEWKRYRIALNRLPEQAGYPATIDWPVSPA